MKRYRDPGFLACFQTLQSSTETHLRRAAVVPRLVDDGCCLPRRVGPLPVWRFWGRGSFLLGGIAGDFRVLLLLLLLLLLPHGPGLLVGTGFGDARLLEELVGTGVAFLLIQRVGTGFGPALQGILQHDTAALLFSGLGPLLLLLLLPLTLHRGRRQIRGKLHLVGTGAAFLRGILHLVGTGIGSLTTGKPLCNAAARRGRCVGRLERLEGGLRGRRPGRLELLVFRINLAQHAAHGLIRGRRTSARRQRGCGPSARR